jgi:conjugative coupling factor TraD (SXT/TOL subfamily)
MPKSYPLNNLLRPPIELIAAASSAVAAILLAEFPAFFMLPPVANKSMVLAISLLVLHQIWRAYQVVRYQRHLRKLPNYMLASSKIPVSDKKLFLVKGFRWLPIHTQRLYDCQRAGSEKYLRPNFLVRWFRKEQPTSPLGGNPYLHGVELKEKDVWMDLSERVGHMLVLGTTRVGKTRFLEVLVTQDIARGDVVIVFDPKGDADLLRRIVFEAKRCNREEDLIIFHLGFPESSARYNPIGQFARITEVANRVANQLPGSGESVAFKEFGWRFVNIIAKALVALGRKPDYQQIQRYILNIDHLLLDYCKLWLPTVNPDWEQIVKRIQQEIDEFSLPIHLKTRSRFLIATVKYIQQISHYDAIADGLCSAFNYDKTYFDKITASLLPLLEKLTSGNVAELLSPDYFDLNDERPVFEWMQVIRGKKIVYVGLDALSDSTIAAAVGSSMFSDLCSVAGQLYKFGVDGNCENTTQQKTQYKISVHGDEFNELVNEDVTTLLNKGGGAGLQLTLYTQTWSDVEAKIGNAAKAGQIAGNLNTLVCLRVLEERTARFLTDKLPQKVSVSYLQHYSSVSDSPLLGQSEDFSSSNEDRLVTIEVPMLTANDLLQLPKGQAFCLIEGGQLWKLRIPLPEDDMHDIPQAIEQMAWLMQKKYDNSSEVTS